MLIAGRGGGAAGARRPLAGRQRRLPRHRGPPPLRRARRDHRRRSTGARAIRLSSIDQDQPFAFRAQAAEVAARGIREAEPELEKLTRSGYRTVVTFAVRGEGERAAYNLGRLKVEWLGDRRGSSETAVSGDKP